jgi:hypothetical protein
VPGEEHQVLVDLFTYRPQMAVWLLERSGIPVPAHDEIEVLDGRITLVTALGERPMAADLVLVCRNAGQAVQGIVVEPQRSQDEGKQQSCHVYQVVFWAILGCPVALLMLCTRRGLTHWFADRFGAGVENWVSPPVVLDLDVLLSIFSHGRSGAFSPRACSMALAAIAATDPNRAERYTDAILKYWLRGQDKEVLMSTLSNESYVFQSEFYTDRIKAAEQAAAEAARAEALAEGEAAGEAVGELHGEAKALLRILAVRGFIVATALRDQIMTCEDPARLEQALDLALTADPGQAFEF